MTVVNWDAVADLLSEFCLVAGALLSFAAGVGVLRFPDLLSRMHAATKPQALGLLLVLAGVALHVRAGLTLLLLAGLFQLLTAPVTAHIVGRTVYETRRHGPTPLLVDELADRMDGEQR